MTATSGVSPLAPIDTSQLRVGSIYDPNATANAFEKHLGTAGGALNAAYPTIGAALNQFGPSKGAAYTNLAVMGFNGGGGVGFPGYSAGGQQPIQWGNNAGLKGYALPGTAPGFPGAGGMPGAGGFPGGGGVSGMPGGGMELSNLNAQIEGTASSQMMFIAMQAKVQNIALVHQAVSNIAKVEFDTKANSVRNFRQ